MKPVTTLRGTLFALTAVISWGTLIAFSRTLTELLGKYTAGGCVCMAGGLISFFVFPPKKRKFSFFYHALGGGCAVVYLLAFNISIGIAANRTQTVELGVINYLWPFLTLLFSLLYFRQKFSPVLLLVGTLLTLTGVVISSSALSGVAFSAGELAAHFCASPLPYCLMLTAALCWAVYSVIVSAAAKQMETDALPWFLLLGGILLFLLRFPAGETSRWNFTVLWHLALAALIPLGLGYACWDKAMLAGKTAPAILLSYLTPLFSALASAFILQLTLPWKFYAACVLVIAGALVSRLSVKKTPGTR